MTTDGPQQPDDNGVNWEKQSGPPGGGQQQGWSGPPTGGQASGAQQGWPAPPPSGYPPGGQQQAWSGPPQGGPAYGGPQAWSAPPANYGAPQGAGGYPVPSGQGEFPMLPPGVEPASHGRRIGAYFLAIPLVIVTLVIGYLIWGLVLWGKGTSPALRLLGLRCVDANTGRPVTFGRMALRDIVGGIVQGIVGAITGLVSFVLFLSTAKRQTLPDLIGTTVVVYDPNRVLDR